MKKLILCLLLLSNVLMVRAEELNIPADIYYYQENLYSYLKYDEKIYNYCSISNFSECKVFIEYNWRIPTDSIWQKIELIEITNSDMRNLIVRADDQYLLMTDLKLSDLIFRSRYVVYNQENLYSEWSNEEKVKTFDFSDAPTPIISNINVYDANSKVVIDYAIDNLKEIEEYFIDYRKIYNFNINYILEYRLNDVAWKELLDTENIDINDAKIEIRLNYAIDKYKSNTSNTLLYEKHPTVHTCLFESELCCNKILNISLCIWLLCLFVIVTLTLIVLENINRRKKEA